MCHLAVLYIPMHIYAIYAYMRVHRDIYVWLCQEPIFINKTIPES